MSLLATASPWDSGDSFAPSNKKRISTMALPRKTLKNHRESGAATEQESFEELNPAHLGGRIAGQPLSMEETKLKQNSNSLKINGLLNKITGFESESGRLADFKPPPPPTLTKTPITHPTQKMTPENPLIPALPPSREPASPLKQFYQPFAKSHNNHNSEFSNYVDAHSNRISYSPSLSSSNKDDLPYYAKTKDDRINYIVHMLEEMQKEKTNHITEEFVLYTMLGVFIIYVVDGFARIGTKYVR